MLNQIGALNTLFDSFVFVGDDQWTDKVMERITPPSIVPNRENM